MTGTRKRMEDTPAVQDAGHEFGKAQISACEKYRDHRDLVNALLDDEKKYTFEVVDNLIEKYRKGQVK